MTRDKKRYRGQKPKKVEPKQKQAHRSPMVMGNDETSKIRADQIAEGKRMMLIEALEEMKSKEQK